MRLARDLARHSILAELDIGAIFVFIMRAIRLQRLPSSIFLIGAMRKQRARQSRHADDERQRRQRAICTIARRSVQPRASKRRDKIYGAKDVARHIPKLRSLYACLVVPFRGQADGVVPPRSFDAGAECHTPLCQLRCALLLLFRDAIAMSMLRHKHLIISGSHHSGLFVFHAVFQSTPQTVPPSLRNNSMVMVTPRRMPVIFEQQV